MHAPVRTEASKHVVHPRSGGNQFVRRGTVQVRASKGDGFLQAAILVQHDAGCDEGNVYDLSSKSPRVAYRIADNIDIYWLDIHDGVVSVKGA